MEVLRALENVVATRGLMSAYAREIKRHKSPELKEALQKYRQEYKDTYLRTLRLIDSLPRKDWQLIITMHYLENMTWQAVALETSISVRRVYQLRDAAIAWMQATEK